MLRVPSESDRSGGGEVLERHVRIPSQFRWNGASRPQDLTDDHVVARGVNGVDRNQTACGVVQDRELLLVRFATNHHFVVSVGEAGYLQLQVRLVRPEPRNSRGFLRTPHKRGRGDLRLGDCILDRLDPVATLTGERMRQRGAVAGGYDLRIAGARERVHNDSTIDFKTETRSEIGICYEPNAHQ